MLFNNNKNWLKFRTKMMIKENNKVLFIPFHVQLFQRIISNITSKEKWFTIFLIVIGSFLISSFLIKVEFLNFINIEADTLKILVDQRTTNIASIFSFTLVVIGFLISNISIKSTLTLELLFKNSYIYPTIYFTLSTIGCLIIISTLRDTKIVNFNYTNAVLTGTYFAILILILIGSMFAKIIKFTNDKEINNLLHDEFIKEAKGIIYNNLLKKYSHLELKKTAILAGAKEYSFAEAWNLITSIEGYIEESNDDKIIKKIKEGEVVDINLEKISSLIRDKTSKNEIIYFNNISLGDHISDRNRIVWEKSKTKSKWNTDLIKKCVVIKKKNKQVIESDIYRKYFDKKITELTEQSKFKELDMILYSYNELYSIQMKSQNHV